jgi:predicted PurR-regulated permease PerM
MNIRLAARSPARTEGEAGAPTTRALAATERSISAVHIVAVVAVVFALWWGQAVLIPVVLSVLISYALAPLIDRLESWHVHRLIAVPLVLTALLTAVGAGGYALRGEAVAFVDRLPDAAQSVSRLIHKTPLGAAGAAARLIEEASAKTFGWLWQGSHGLVTLVGQIFVVLCLVFYLLVAGDLYKRKLVRMVPRLSNKKITLKILAEIDRQIERFLLARTAISFIVGSAVWIAFRLLGFNEAGMWGVFAAVLFAIPILGPTVLVLCAGVAGFMQFDSLAMAAAAAGICAAIGIVEGNVLTPLLLSRAGEMNAVAVFVSLLFWGWLWGFWGLLLAVPITAALKAVCERVEDFNAFAELLKE